MASNVSEDTPLLGSENRNKQRNTFIGSQESVRLGNVLSSCCGNFGACLSNVTVEFPLFFYLFVWSFQGIIRTNILMDKSCEGHFQYGDEICKNLNNHSAEQTSVQQFVMKITLYSSLIESIPGVLFVLFLGAWSDKYGRKIPLTLPHVGNLISDLMMLVNILVWVIPVEYILLASIPRGLTGGFACLVMVSNSYIVDITRRENRTIRIAFLDLFYAIGPPFGLILCTFVFGRFSYAGTYVFSASIFLICIMYIIIRITETRGPNAVVVLDVEQLLNQGQSHGGQFMSLFDCKNLKETFRITFKKRENYGRARILLLMSAMCCLVAVFSSLSIDYLYAMRKFSWNYVQYIYLCVSSLVITGIGLGVALPILTLLCHSSDILLAIIGCVSLIGLKLTQAFANVGYVMFIGAAVGFFGGLPLVVCRSMMSKLVSSQDTGKIFSVLAAYESLVPLIASPIFVLTYNATIDTYIFAYLLVGVGAYLMALILFLIVWVLNGRNVNGSGTTIN